MADERYFWGNTLASFFRTSPAIVESTTAGRFDSTFVPNSIRIPAGAGHLSTMPFIDATAPTTLWTHFELVTLASDAGIVFVQWLNSAGTIVARLRYSSVQIMAYEHWNGSAFVTDFTFSAPATTLLRFDVAQVAGASGSCVAYLSGSPVGTVAALHAAVTNFASIRWLSNGFNDVNVSQVMGANFDTRDSRYHLDPLAAVGGLTGGTGAIGAVNETVLDESTAWALSATGQQRSATHDTLTLPAGYQVAAACASARGRINGSGPADGKLGFRKITGGLTTTGPALGLNTGYEPRGHYSATDPNTGSDWTQAGYNDTEVYVEAA